MTRRELSQLYYLKKEIKMQQKRLAELETVAANCTAKITGLPSGKGVSDKIGKYAAKIADLRAQIDLNLKKCVDELKRLEDFIQTVDDSQMRTILTLRYINCYSWQKIAFKIGKYDEQYPRRKHNEFLKNSRIIQKHDAGLRFNGESLPQIRE